MSELTKCGICGSKDIERIETEGVSQLTLGPEFKFKEIYYQCHNCGEEVDYFAETDKYYLEAKKKAQAESVKTILEKLDKEQGIKMSFLERVFELPKRTLTRWKNGDFSSSSLALLRILSVCSWIAEVAEYKFDKIILNQKLIEEANQCRVINVPSSCWPSASIDIYNVSETSVNTRDYQSYPVISLQ